MQRQQSALLTMARTWHLHEDDLSRAIAAVVETAVDAVGAERASVWMLGQDRDRICCSDLFERGTRRHTQGGELLASDFPGYFRAIEVDEIIAAHDARQDPRTREFTESYLVPLGIGAMLDAPIRVGGRCVGVLCNEHVGDTRTWTVDDQNAAAYLASLLSLALEMDRRRDGERRLEESLSLLRATMEAIGEGILAVDREGSVVAWNQRFLDMWALDPRLLGAAGDGGPRLARLAEQSVDPLGYAARAREIFRNPTLETVDTIHLLDGRVIERISRPQHVGHQVIGRVWSFRDVTQQKRTEEALRQAEALQRQLATHDSLTGLLTRGRILECLELEMLRADRTDGTLSVVMLDVDCFKQINDQHGHVAGDEVLRVLSRDLQERLRRTDFVGRYGGEEFLVLLPDTAGPVAASLFERIVSHVARPRTDVPWFTISAGVAEYKRGAMRALDLIGAADERLYEAKRAGRNRVA